MHLLRIVTGEETNLKMDSKKAAADVDMEDGEAKDDGVLPPIAFELMRALGVWIYKVGCAATGSISCLSVHTGCCTARAALCGEGSDAMWAC